MPEDVVGAETYGLKEQIDKRYGEKIHPNKKILFLSQEVFDPGRL